MSSARQAAIAGETIVSDAETSAMRRSRARGVAGRTRLVALQHGARLRQIGEGEAVVAGDVVDAGARAAAVAPEEIGAAGEAHREVGQRRRLLPPEAPDGLAILVVPLRPVEREVADLVAVGAGVPRLGIPALQSSDASMGVTNPGYRPDDKGATAFPASIAVGASFNPQLARAGGEAIGREARILDAPSDETWATYSLSRCETANRARGGRLRPDE